MTVAELLEKPEAWTQGASAKNSDGMRTGVSAESAVCWCVLGAIWKCYVYDSLSEKMRDKLAELVGDIVKFNDAPGRTHAEVLEAVRKAGI